MLLRRFDANRKMWMYVLWRMGSVCGGSGVWAVVCVCMCVSVCVCLYVCVVWVVCEGVCLAVVKDSVHRRKRILSMYWWMMFITCVYCMCFCMIHVSVCVCMYVVFDVMCLYVWCVCMLCLACVCLYDVWNGQCVKCICLSVCFTDLCAFAETDTAHGLMNMFTTHLFIIFVNQHVRCSDKVDIDADDDEYHELKSTRTRCCIRWNGLRRMHHYWQ